MGPLALLCFWYAKVVPEAEACGSGLTCGLLVQRWLPRIEAVTRDKSPLVLGPQFIHLKHETKSALYTMIFIGTAFPSACGCHGNSPSQRWTQQAGGPPLASD